MPGEAVAVAGPVTVPRVAPGPVGDAGQAGQQEEGQVVEAGDGFGPDRGLDAGDLRVLGTAVPEYALDPAAFTMDVVRPDLLMVPTAKNGVATM